MTESDRMNENLANLVATIESVAAGDIFDDGNIDNTEHELVTAEMLEGTVLHLSNGQSINVVQMTGSLEDAINVVQVETTELGDHDVSTMEGICAIDIDTEERTHILNETGAHVVVKTEDEVVHTFQNEGPTSEGKPQGIVLPTIPFSFPGQSFDIKCQKLILNVWDFFKRLKKNPDILDEIRTPQERAAAALHISAATIGKIGKKFTRTGKLEMPGKTRNRTKPIVDSVKPEHEQIIRDVIKDLKDSGTTPTLPFLLHECRERINFQGGPTSFRRILNRMGFKGMSQANKANASNPTKYKSSSSSGISNTSPAKLAPSQSTYRKISKPINLENGFLSIPISTPNTSPVKNASARPLLSYPSQPVSPPRTLPKMTPPAAAVNNETIQLTPKTLASLFGNSMVQAVGTRESITISQEAANALMAGTRIGDGPQTFHLLNADNTIQQIQIVYSNMPT